MVSLAMVNVSVWFLAISVLVSLRIVEMLTCVVSDPLWKNRMITRTMTSASMSQMKLFLSHFPLLVMGMPSLYIRQTGSVNIFYTSQHTNSITLSAVCCFILSWAIIAYLPMISEDGARQHQSIDAGGSGGKEWRGAGFQG